MFTTLTFAHLSVFFIFYATEIDAADVVETQTYSNLTVPRTLSCRISYIVLGIRKPTYGSEDVCKTKTEHACCLLKCANP